jgi:hypothetical protein
MQSTRKRRRRRRHRQATARVSGNGFADAKAQSWKRMTPILVCSRSSVWRRRKSPTQELQARLRARGALLPPEAPRSSPDEALGVRLFCRCTSSRSQKPWRARSGDDERADITPGGFKGRLRLVDAALIHIQR